MSSAQVQGELWGAKARDWAELQEPAWRPVYEQVLERAGVRPGARLLDVGCGAGGALVVARERGAEVAGLDASAALVAVASARLPDARIEVGDMEALPFVDGAFDIVTSFNAFQFAADIGRALGEARRVCRAGGRVAMLVWGAKEACDLSREVLPPVFALMPAPPAAAPASPPLARPGVMESGFEAASLRPIDAGDVQCDFVYPDLVTATRAIESAGGLVRVVREAGEAEVRRQLRDALTPFVRADGSIILHNTFRWVLGTPR
jgi:SAM-dependent methyltransferase